MDKTGRRNIDVVLAEAQARLRRLSPVDALASVSEGWTLVDTRDGDMIARDGAIAGALRIPFGVLEWGGFGAWLAAGRPVER